MIRVRLLGEVSCDVAGQPVDLGRHQQRLVFALLAVHAGHAVAPGAIEDELWSTSATRSILPLISRLRRSLAVAGVADPNAVLPRTAGGYRLAVAADDVDLLHAEAQLDRAAAAADPAEAIVLFDRALQTLRREAFPGLAPGARLAAAASRAERHRLEGEVRLLESRLRVEDPAVVVGAAADAHAQHPVNERLAVVAATAMYRAGRHADVLQVIDRTRRALAEQHGLDPGPALRRLQAAVLAEDPLPRSAGSGAHLERTAGAPAAVHPIIGRHAVVEAILDRLQRTRQLTVVGVGGMGKSTVVQHLCRRHVPRDELAYVDLGRITDPGDVGAALRQGLGLPPRPVDDERSLAAGLDDVLASRRFVLVLDQCEHLLDPVATMVVGLLGRYPLLTVLATSRSPLDIPGEHVLRLPPLEVPTSTDDEEIRASGAVQLLAQRTVAMAGQLPSAAQLAELARAVGGHPLSLELLAARLAGNPAGQVIATLPQQLLTARRRGVAAAGESLPALISWSLRALPDGAGDVLEAMTVWHGPTAAAEALHTAGWPTSDTSVLDGLVRGSLLETVEDGHLLLPAIRIAVSAQVPQARRAAMADRRLGYLAQLGAGGSVPDQRTLSRLSPDALAAVAWGLGNDRVADAAAVVSGWWWHWYTSEPAAGWAAVSRLRARIDEVPVDRQGPVLGAHAFLAFAVGAIGEAIGDLDRLREVPTDPLTDLAAARIEAVLYAGIDPDRARRVARAATDRATARGDRWEAAVMGSIAARIDVLIAPPGTAPPPSIDRAALVAAGDVFNAGFAEFVEAEWALRHGTAVQRRSALGTALGALDKAVRAGWPIPTVTALGLVAGLLDDAGDPTTATAVVAWAQQLAAEHGIELAAVAPELSHLSTRLPGWAAVPPADLEMVTAAVEATMARPA